MNVEIIKVKGNTGRYAVVEFDGPLDYAEEVKKPPAFAQNRDIHGSHLNRSATENTSFYGGNYKKFEKLLVDGWVDGATKALNTSHEIAGALPRQGMRKLKRTPMYDECGDELEMDRVYSGNPNFFRDMSRSGMRRAPAVSLVVTAGGNADKTEEQLFWCGAAGACLADILEESGYRCRIVVCMPGRHGQGVQLITVKIKDYDEPLRSDVVASVACSRGVFRNHGFMAVAHAPFKIDSGLGSMIDDYTALPKDFLDRAFSDDAFIMKSAYTKAAAQKEIERGLKELSVLPQGAPIG